MDNFLGKYQGPKFNHDQLNHLNTPISPKEIEEVIKSLTTSKSPGAGSLSGEFYQNFKEDLITTLFKLSHIEVLGKIRNSMPIPKHNKSIKQQTNSQHQTKWRAFESFLLNLKQSQKSGTRQVAHSLTIY